MVIGILFLTFFAAIALALSAFTEDKAKETRETLSRLEAIARAPQEPGAEDEDLAIRREESLSSVPWLDRLLSRTGLSAKLRLYLYQANLKWTVGRLLVTMLLAAVIAADVAYLRTRSVLPSFCAGLIAGYAPFLYVLRKRDQRFERIRQLLPETLDLMVAAIRAGHSLSSAMGMASREAPEPLRRELRQCFDEQNFGVELRTAMMNLAYRIPIHDVRLIATAVLIQKDSGGNLTEVLEKAAHLIREDFRLRRQIRVHTAQGRLTGWILSVLPPALGFALYLINPEYMSLLWTRPQGIKLLYASVAMTVTGGLIIRRIVRFRI